MATAALPLLSALISAVGPTIMQKLFGQADKHLQTPLQTPQQQAGLSQILGNMQQLGGEGGNYQQAQDYLSKLLSRDPGAYDQFAQPYLQQFQQQVIPGISERFAGAGGGLGGALQSSGFAQALGGAGSDLQAKLAQLYSGMQRGAASDATNQYNNLANLGLNTRAFQPDYQPGHTGGAGGLSKGFDPNQLGGLFEQIGNYFGDKKTGIQDTISSNPAAGPGNPYGASYNSYTGVQ